MAQFVRTSTDPRLVNVRSGVPQRSVIGLLLFLIFIIDLAFLDIFFKHINAILEVSSKSTQ